MGQLLQPQSLLSTATLKTYGVGAGAHTHPESDVVNLISDLGGKSAMSHTHAEADVTSLLTDLGNKSAVGHSHAESDVTSLISDLGAKSALHGSQNTQTAAYTLVLSDDGTIIEMNSASGVNLTVPPNSAVAFAIGTMIEVFQLGAGQVTFVQGAGVTIHSPTGLVKTATQYASATLRKRGTDEWCLEGDLA